jgi:2-keto-4-pentenoate hydratase/2-oxohepta-3-ene-1,7-dioic acid hydratase in catechol pathway
MRLAAVRQGSAWVIGLVEPDLQTVRLLEPAVGTVDDVVRGVVGPTALSAAAAQVQSVPLSEVELGAPVQRFNRDVLCTGWNYLDHFFESMGKREGQDPEAMPAHPTFFTKGPDTVVGPYDSLAYDSDLSAKWDYEAEIALVIGKDGRSISEQDAWDHIFGYTLANDISQRDLQRAHGGQWLKGKSIDQTMPLGPWITTVDEIDDIGSIPIECEVKGTLLQNATVDDMAYSIPRLIAELSRGMTLRAGDVVLTGTPSGIGNAREPAVFLAAGDVVVTRAGVLGELRNTLTARSLV